MPPRTDLVLSLLLHVAAGAAWWLSTTTAAHSAPAALELTALPSTPLLVAVDPPVDPARPHIEPDPGMEAEPEPQEPSTEAAPIDYLADASSEPMRVLEGRARDQLQQDGLQTALAGLDPRSRRIVEARWLSDDSSATLHELAAEFGVSAERIRQIEAKALQKMRLSLAPLVAA